jgi:hypothetical protein
MGSVYIFIFALSYSLCTHLTIIFDPGRTELNDNSFTRRMEETTPTPRKGIAELLQDRPPARQQ